MSYLKKHWYLSKTLWLNAVAIGIGALMCVQEFLVAGDTSPMGITTLALGILNFVNRFFTTKELE
jgi:hypothetical protein